MPAPHVIPYPTGPPAPDRQTALRDNVDALEVHPVPEPLTLAGLAAGIGCLARYLRRRRV